MSWVIDWWIFIFQAKVEAKLELCNFWDFQGIIYINFFN